MNVLWQARIQAVNVYVPCWLLWQGSCQWVRRLVTPEEPKKKAQRPQLLQQGWGASRAQIIPLSRCVNVPLISMPTDFLLHVCSIFPKFLICFPFYLPQTRPNINPFPLWSHKRFTGSRFSWPLCCGRLAEDTYTPTQSFQVSPKIFSCYPQSLSRDKPAMTGQS